MFYACLIWQQFLAIFEALFSSQNLDFMLENSDNQFSKDLFFAQKFKLVIWNFFNFMSRIAIMIETERLKLEMENLFDNLGFFVGKKNWICGMGFRLNDGLSRLFPSGNWWNKGISRKRTQKSQTSSFSSFQCNFCKVEVLLLLNLKILLLKPCFLPLFML